MTTNLVKKNGHHYRLCDECKILRRHTGFSWGKWLCRRCINKKILGKSDEPKFKFEMSVIKKRLRAPYLTEGDSRFLYEKYDKNGLTKKEIYNRLRSVRARIVLAHRRLIESEQERQGNIPILPERVLGR
jgi:ribosomal protein L37AE/L43A